MSEENRPPEEPRPPVTPPETASPSVNRPHHEVSTIVPSGVETPGTAISAGQTSSEAAPSALSLEPGHGHVRLSTPIPAPHGSLPLEESPLSPAMADEAAEREIRRMSRRSFVWGAVAVAVTYKGWRWLITRPDEKGIGWPFRRTLEINEELAKDFFQPVRLTPTFARAMASVPRENGFDGMPDLNSDSQNVPEFDPATWKLRVMGLADMSMAVEPSAASGADNSDTGSSDSADATPPAPKAHDKKAAAPHAPDKKGSGAKKPVVNASNDTSSGDSSDSSDGTDSGGSAMANMPAVELTLAAIKALPRFEMTTEFKCIEGWSVIVNWTGARFVDFMAKYGPQTKSGDAPDAKNKPQDLVDYVSMETPDGGYYVGLDMASCLHPQTMLCYEMNGKPLTIEHGAPLRLVIPVKYGVKNIKRIGMIHFTSEKPRDFWAEQGYDWYAGH